ncbi:unnamed protein product [Bursaphelenchus xylophilus]|uniref:(pine wood nematode) hypothetical protein n=1 Tax=Bursaphelenchus xylophilus TaxID=6326 RepID=A0A1I7RW17_BURXY|nr:unnamed protein product [Bursaphelenchus xylophilus]CAG9095014.1 unnamed protein product [Bursaphelenchus xylophilus]
MQWTLIYLSATVATALSTSKPPQNSLTDGLDVLYESNKLNQYIEDLVDVSDRTKASLGLAANLRKRVDPSEVSSFNQFFRFIIEFQKEYRFEREIGQAFQRFKAAEASINAAKKRNPHAEFGVTKFSDLSTEEFIQQYTGVPPSVVDKFKAGKTTVGSTASGQKDSTLTHTRVTTVDEWSSENQTESRFKRSSNSTDSSLAAFDWRLLGGVTEIKDQGKCAASYAFAAIAAIESIYTIKFKKAIDLSEQHAIACTYNNTDYENDGCNGGDPSEILQFAVDQGLVTENSWPYKLQFYRNGSKIAKCRQFKNQQRYFDYFEFLPMYDEDSMKQKLISNGPLVSYIDATDLQFYLSGIITAKSRDINHAVLTVGHGLDVKAGPYWIAKNSWGKDFGEQGYIRFGLGKNSANIGAFNIEIVP